jgi:DNA-binding winged helix-turn-helix (wHTH) protein
MDQEHFEAAYPDTVHEEVGSRIASYLTEGNSCQVLGLPGVGRSTLLSLFAYNKAFRKKHFGKSAEEIHFVLINFAEIKTRPLFDVMKFLFLNLTESLRERKLIEEHKVVGDIFREHLSFHDELILFQGFKEAMDYLSLKKKRTVIFLFDRFEEYIPTVTNEFFANLQAIRNREKYRFLIVFSVYRLLETQLEPALLADFYEFVAGNVVYMPLYDKKTTDFRIALIEEITKKKIPVRVLSEIITLTGGIGRIVKLSVESYLARWTPKEELSSFLLAQKALRAALLEIWFSLSPAEQSDLRQGNFDDQSVALHLEQMGLIKEKKIQVPLLTKLIQEEFGKPQVSSVGIVYDEHTNTIKKGEDVLSDQLTASEFRLLRYLLQNPDRIVEREDIIEVVWQEMKSTAGITDQAVDQLVFRLRRKIEEDPNNPIHLQTVKGRGFKFVG